MTVFRTRIATTLTATGIAAGTLLGLGVITAHAAPTSVAVPGAPTPATTKFPPAPATPAPAPAPASAPGPAGQAPSFIAKQVHLTFVNNTGLTLRHKADYQSPDRTISPGESVHLPGMGENSRSFDVATADGRTHVRVLAYNPVVGFPYAQASIHVEGAKAQGRREQREGDRHVVASLGNTSVTSHRDHDDDGKRFTMILTQSPATIVIG